MLQVRQSLSEESIEALQEIFDDDEGLARQVLVSYWSNNLMMVKYQTPTGYSFCFLVTIMPRVE